MDDAPPVSPRISAQARRISIALIDDSELVRLGLRTLLENQAEFEIVGEAMSGRTARELISANTVDVVLLDIRLPDSSGIDVCRFIQSRAPSTRVIFLTTASDKQTVDEAIRAGAHGYLLKEIDAGALIRAIHTVASGGSVLDSAITSNVFSLVKSPEQRNPLGKLSAQEIKVLALIASGKTNKEAAHSLGLSEKTVKNYLSTVFEKLQVVSRAQAAAIYAQFSQTRA